MSKSFTIPLVPLLGTAILCVLAFSQSQNASGKSEEPPKGEKGTETETYSKYGSDSISLIIFGKIVVPKTTPTAPVSNTKAGTSDKGDKSKKEKFSIKSSDKLKTNHSLY